MTIEEAIKDIKECIKPSVGGISLDMAIKALEKQLPIKVEEGTEGGFDWYCSCGTYLSPVKCNEIKYCINCGQKLNWK